MAAAVGEPAFGIQSRHAAGARGRDGLPVVVIGHIACGKDALHAGVCAEVLLPLDVLLARER